MEEQDNNAPRRTWNLMIGISIVVLGSLKLYNRIQEESDWSFRLLFIAAFIVFGFYLILRHFLNPPKK